MATFNGGNDPDIYSGGSGDDVIAGYGGADRLNGGFGNDTLYAGAVSPVFTTPYYGNPWTPPVLDDGTEADRLDGGDGDDRIFAGYGDTIIGGAGYDTLFISFLGSMAGVTADFRLTTQTIGGGSISGIESIGWVSGSNFDDVIYAGNDNGGFAPIFGYGGNDHIIAGYYTGQLYGGDGNDILDNTGAAYGSPMWGEAGDDLLIGGGGYEYLYGGDGNDVIRGNYGYDRLYGDAGNDVIDGGSFEDWLYGGTGDDVLYGAGDADFLYGQAGDDTLYGDFSLISSAGGTSPASNDDKLAGGSGADTLYGDVGNDTLASGDLDATYLYLPVDDAGTERDRLFGGADNDTLSIGYGDDADGGSGNDVLRLSLLGASGRVMLDTGTFADGATATIAGGGTITAIERLSAVVAGNGGLTLTAATTDELLQVIGGTAADIVTSAGSSVEFAGGAGDDVLHSGIAADIFYGGEGRDLVSYASYGVGVTVKLSVSAPGGDQLTDVEDVAGTSFNDVLEGDGAGNFLQGNSGDDVLVGYSGNDTLDGRDFGGASVVGDRLIGGKGNDAYMVDGLNDIIFEDAASGTDRVSSSGSHYMFANVEELGLLDGNLFGVGNALDNMIFGQNGDNLLIGGAGNDQLSGNNGNDSLFGETGDDQLFGGMDIDYLAGGSGNDYLDGQDGADAIFGEDGNDQLYGGKSFDTDILVGGAGDDALDGASGLGDYDLMDGGAGNDSYLVDTPDDLTFEAAGGGTDTVYANINGAGYYLYAFTENLVLGGNTPFGVGNELANQLTGNAIGNYLLGGLGNDTLNGKAGNDVLFGEGGADTFVFERGTGGDVIGDFQGGVDKIRLVGLGFAGFAQLQASFVENGGTTAINLGAGDFVVLNGVANAALSANDFIFG